MSLSRFILQSLTGIKGLSEAKVDKICEAAEKIVVSVYYKFQFIRSYSYTVQVFMVLFLIQNFGYITGSDALLRVRCSFV